MASAARTLIERIDGDERSRNPRLLGDGSGLQRPYSRPDEQRCRHGRGKYRESETNARWLTDNRRCRILDPS
jgi:hypothetical protein